MKAFAIAGLMILAVACVPREILLPTLGLEVPVLRDFPAGFRVPVSNETGQPVTGFGGGGGGVQRTPVIFVHGNTVAPRFWLGAREYFKSKGYTDDELWAVGYGWDTVRKFDSNDASVPTIEAFVSEVQRYLSEQEGQPIHQFDVISHSLGVTLMRQWMKQENAWHRVRHFVGVAGANHGVWTASADARGENRTVAFELYHGSPWLAQLNRGGETPGPTQYLTIYDGTGWQDVLFPEWSKDSSALEGAENVAFNVEHGTWYDHLELPREPETMDLMVEFFGADPLPPAGVKAPRLVLDGELRADVADARVFCAAGGDYPDREGEGRRSVALTTGELHTCFSLDSEAGLASPMHRYKPPTGEAGSAPAPPAVETKAGGGAYDYPLFVELSTDDPDAYIVYTTSGSVPESGSPLYEQPIYIAGPLTVTAVAIAPGGAQSEPVRVVYDHDLDAVNRRHSLQRQYAPSLRGQFEEGPGDG